MMEPTGFGLLSALLAVPLIGALVVLFVPEQFSKAIKGAAMIFSLLAFVVSVVVFQRFEPGTYHMQLVEFVPWIDQLGIHYRVGIDGVSLWLVLLTTFLNVIAVWFSFYIEKRVKTYFAMVLILLTAMLGVFLSLDLILFYAFFEASLIPMAVMIWIWGGSNRNYAAVKFFVYTFAASIFMLVGMIAMAGLHREATGVMSFDLLSLQAEVANGRLWVGEAMKLQPLLFWAFALAFMVKCPMFPFHTWLPDAHTEAPTAGSVILAGVLLKMGTFGFLRLALPLFPEAARQAVPVVMTLAVVGIIYGAVVAAVQPDVKKLVAYSSVAHMGFVMLGIFSLTHNGIVGGAYQQLNHGISTGALFLLVGLLYERIHTRLFADMGGLKAQMPIFAALFLIVMLSSVGLPGLNGFVGEFLALMGAFEAGVAGFNGLNLWYPAIAGVGVILAAVYLLWMFQKVFYGPVNPNLVRLKDLKPGEIAMVSLLILFAVWGGVYPNTFIKPMEKALGAVRLMTVNEPGQRPVWADSTLEIDHNGDLVRVTPRRPGSYGEYTVLSVVAPANLHVPVQPEARPAPGGATARRAP
ncbi:MAG: NADH-quinone oxidoreductase subunit M [Fimbriimonadaceae bacterium]|nr:NADH-quinone oxidoreductase subunit M [Fimbriimonadaceae bacterium]QYK57746.1 MAG: NADH-quinone oxidoreductase subunit M [Fimbriimonadaceae bacterium]